MTCKIVPDMTCNVFVDVKPYSVPVTYYMWSGTLNSTHSLTHSPAICNSIPKPVLESYSMTGLKSPLKTFPLKVKVKRTCIAPFVKLQLKALRYGSHRVAPANYTIPASTLRTFARCHHLNGKHLIPAHYSFIDPGRMKG